MIKRIDLNNEKEANFIGCWNTQNDEVMDQIIQYFNNHKEDQEIGVGGFGEVDLERKDSTDLTILPKDLESPEMECFSLYFNLLNDCYWDYLETWSFLKNKWGEMYIGPFNIQKYEINGHYKTWHSEREGIYTSHRVFAWMTYLNDVEDGGSTDFLHFDISVRPKKGRTLIWPAEWTHAHRGSPVKEEKFIITGWFHFPVPQ
ncbi:MAG: 2OG-Fe(II) oxygenase [Pseudomonadota bacterium]|nr:2OG-Fe(II) oxygenase [Pseudomonadota bacterium]